MTELLWTDVPAEDLDVRLLHDVLALRCAVFVVEQECAYQDVDGLDLVPGTVHVLARRGSAIAAYARVLAPGDHPTPRIGRVIVDPTVRGQQLGRRVVERSLAVCERRWPGEPVELGGQAHLRAFYEGLGFVARGEEYVEDGIPHVWMRRDPLVP